MLDFDDAEGVGGNPWVWVNMVRLAAIRFGARLAIPRVTDVVSDLSVIAFDRNWIGVDVVPKVSVPIAGVYPLVSSKMHRRLVHEDSARGFFLEASFCSCISLADVLQPLDTDVGHDQAEARCQRGMWMEGRQRPGFDLSHSAA